jgi:serine/threonine-protein kinase
MVEVGTCFGPYEILARLGVGGMGEVYRARDKRLDREVAIKILPEKVARDSDRLARFEAEAKAVAALAHPNILILHDFGCEQGVAFAVTELLEGQTLRERMQSAPLSWRKATDIGAAIADGLAAAHAKGFVHRDIKPENIFITSDGRVKILDFGLAQVPEKETALTSTETVVHVPGQTDPGFVMGTVAYMSPEQLRLLPLDGRSDIFSLGCVIYEMLTGRRPFDGETAADTMGAILHVDAQEIANFSSLFPPELGRVVGRCLEKDPQDRFQSARDLAFALRGSTHSSQFVVPVNVAPRPRKLLWIAVGAALVISAVVMGAYFHLSAGWLPASSTTPKAGITALAVLPFVTPANDDDLEYLSESLAEGLSHHLSRSHWLQVRPMASTGQYRGSNVDVQALGRVLQVQAVVMGRLRKRGDECLINIELIDTRDNVQLWGRQLACKSSEVLRVSDDVVLPIVQMLRPDLPLEERRRLTRHFTENAEANQLYLLGRYYWNKRTMEGMQKALKSFSQAIDKDPNFALPHAGLADCFLSLTWLDQQPPMKLYSRSRSEAARALELDPDLAEAHAAMAFVVGCCDWDWSAAESDLQKAIELNPNYASAHQWYARFLSALRRHDEAIAEIKKAQLLDPSSLIINSNVVGALLYAGKLDEALQEAQATLQLDPHFPISHIWLGNVYLCQGKMDLALAEFQEASKVIRGQRLRASMAWTYAALGKKDESQKILKDFLAQKGKGQYVSPVSLAAVYAGLGDNDRAFASLQDAAAVRDPWLVELEVDPNFSPLRSDPRFAELVARMQFPK